MNVEHLDQLLDSGRPEEALSIIEELAKCNLDNAQIQYKAACCCDRLGMESKAINYYLRAIELGLPDPDLRDAILGLGSTYRSIGKFEDAREVFEKGKQRFPSAQEYNVFAAMVYYNLGQQKRAIEDLLRIISETCNDPHVSKYSRAIKMYADNLDQ